MIAIREAYRAGLLNSKYWLPNLSAGLIVGVVALPLAMAFAIASGVKPEQGLYTAIIAALVVGIFGGSRVQIAGPTGAFVVILANITAQYGVEGLQMATLLAGFILLLMGIAKLGSVIQFIPDPVIVGFTSGIGVIIFVGEWKDFFGLPVSLPINAHFYTKLATLSTAIPHLSVETTALACFSLLLMIITPKVMKHLPGPLVALMAATILQASYHFHDVATIGNVFGGITQTLPSFHVPAFDLSQIRSLIAPAFTIALLGAIESLLSASAADSMAGTRHHPNQELIGQGIANVLTPLFGGFAATGAIARTATNIRNGGNSPIAAIVHSIFLVLFILLLAPLASYIPLCSLAAILIVVAYNMSDFPHFAFMLRHAPYYDNLVLLITFLLTIFADLVVAVNVGVILAMLFFVRNMHECVAIEKQDNEQLNGEHDNLKLPDDCIVYDLQGPFFFGAAEKLEHALASISEDPTNIIFRMRNVPFMDMTGLQTFTEIINQFRQRDVNVYLCEANDKVSRKLIKLGITELVVGKRIYHSLKDIGTST